MGACSTCLHCGENHWGSCEPAGYGKCNYCGELYGVQTLDAHQRECHHNPCPGIALSDLPEKVHELEEKVEEQQAEIDRLRGNNADLVKGTEYLTKRLGQEVGMADAARKDRDRLQKELVEVCGSISSYQDRTAQLVAAEEELTLTRAEVVAQTAAKEAALAEVERLKAGRFTEEEFQALCHTFQGDAVCRFRQGCTEYQVKLFGERPVALDLARELRWALRQVCMNDPMEGVAEAMATALVRNDPKAKCTEGRQ